MECWKNRPSLIFNPVYLLFESLRALLQFPHLGLVPLEKWFKVWMNAQHHWLIHLRLTNRNGGQIQALMWCPKQMTGQAICHQCTNNTNQQSHVAISRSRAQSMKKLVNNDTKVINSASNIKSMIKWAYDLQNLPTLLKMWLFHAHYL